MNKRDARKIAYSREFSAGELRELIKEKGKQIAESNGILQSKVNPMVSLSRALGIYEAAIPKEDDRIMRPEARGNGLIIANILRDCAESDYQ